MQTEQVPQDDTATPPIGEGAPPPTDIDPIAIYRINAAEWWAARSLDEALDAAAEWHGLPRCELLDELAPPYELHPDDLKSLLITANSVTTPFWYELFRRRMQGEQFPQLFGQANV